MENTDVLDKYHRGLMRLKSARSEPELLGPALLSLHGALEDSFRAYLATYSQLGSEQQTRVQDVKAVQWRELCEFMLLYGGMTTNQSRYILQMNKLRIPAGHGDQFPGTYEDVEKYARFVGDWINTLSGNTSSHGLGADQNQSVRATNFIRMQPRGNLFKTIKVWRYVTVCAAFLALVLCNFSYKPIRDEIITKGQGTLVAPANWKHKYVTFPINLSGYESGLLVIDIKLSAGKSAGSFDLFTDKASIPTQGRPTKSIAGSYDIPASSGTTLSCEFNKPVKLVFGAEGTWFSPEASRTPFSFVAYVKNGKKRKQ